MYQDIVWDNKYWKVIYIFEYYLNDLKSYKSTALLEISTHSSFEPLDRKSLVSPPPPSGKSSIVFYAVEVPRR